MNVFVLFAAVAVFPIVFFLCAKLQRLGHIAKGWKDFTLFFAIGSLIGLAIVMGISQGAIQLKMMDTEIHSGEIVKKDRVHDHYVETYECNCTTNSKGERSCQTCKRDHYTVKWTAYSNINKDFTIKELDSESRLVYLTPDPGRYTQIQMGDPVAVGRLYKNYLLGIPPEYLWNDQLNVDPTVLARVPNYPRVYDFYNIDRFFDVSGTIPQGTVLKYNSLLANKLKTLGPSKEVNIIVIVAPHDKALKYAVRQKWNGGKKNDVIVIAGMEDGKIIDAQVLTWNKNHLFAATLSDALIDYSVFDDTAMGMIFENVEKHYVRPKMSEFDDLQIYIQPPTWSLVLIYMFLIGAPFAVIAAFEGKFNSRRRRFR